MLLALPIALVAQDAAPMGPPKIIQIVREEVKPGKGAAHEKWEASWTQAMVRAKFTTPQLAMTAVTGNNEAWYISGYDSFGALEADMKMIDSTPAMSSVMQQYSAGDSEYISGTRTMVARYREDLSYQAPIKLGEMRYFQVRTVRVRPGHNDDYAAIRKLINDARTKASLDLHQAVFEVQSGAPTGTFLVFTPAKSMAENDAPPNPAMRDAMGPEEAQKLSDLVSKAIISSEDAIFAFSPKMSNLSPAMAAQSPDFWKPKASSAVAMKTPAPVTKKEPVKK